MAGTTDPRSSAFNAATFRDAIRFAMDMGLPEATADRATFKWTPVKTYPNPDGGGRPYNLTSTPTSTTTHADVQIPVAWEFVARQAQETNTSMGEFDASRIVMTILDDDYSKVVGADTVVLGGNTYTIDFVAPPMGLFSVTVFELYLSARDEA